MTQINHLSSLQNLEHQLNTIVLGKEEHVRLVITCLLSQGHLLLEDAPGSGKTTLAKALSALIDVSYKRIQFTADMLPADILGGLIFDAKSQSFILQKGPIFTNLLLADEINRASAKAQSALLEVMEEKQVSIDGDTFALASPFFVIATQNSIESRGTFELPESQLDRFQMSLSFGYLDETSEIILFLDDKRSSLIENLSPVIDYDQLKLYQQQVESVHLSENMAKYIYRLISYTRKHKDFSYGLSTRAGLSIVKSAKAYAFLCEQSAVFPEHVQAVFVACVAHRIKVAAGSHQALSDNQSKLHLAKQILREVPIKW